MELVISIPEGIEVLILGDTIQIRGPKGEIKKSFKLGEVKVEKRGKDIVVSGKEKMFINTIGAHIKNMIRGVEEGYSRKLQIVYSHFPMSIEVKGKKVFIKNFLGQKEMRSAEIIGNTKVEVDGQNIIVSGIDKENVGQTTANLIKAVKITKKDSRVFQDGLYVVE